MKEEGDTREEGVWLKLGKRRGRFASIPKIVFQFWGWNDLLCKSWTKPVLRPKNEGRKEKRPLICFHSFLQIWGENKGT